MHAPWAQMVRVVSDGFGYSIGTRVRRRGTQRLARSSRAQPEERERRVGGANDNDECKERKEL